MISSFLSIKLSLYVQLDERFPLFNSYNNIACPTRRVSKTYFPDLVQSARMLGYFYGTSGQTVFTVWKARPCCKARTSCFFHWRFFRGYNGVWFWRLSDDFYLTLYLTRREKNSWTKWRHTAKVLHLGENGFVRALDWPFSYATVFFHRPGYMPSYLTSWQIAWIPKKKGFFQNVEIFTFPLTCRKIMHARGHLRPTSFHVF